MAKPVHGFVGPGRRRDGSDPNLLKLWPRSRKIAPEPAEKRKGAVVGGSVTGGTAGRQEQDWFRRVVRARPLKRLRLKTNKETNMPHIGEARIAILATHGYERSELREPLERLREKGATVDVVSLEKGEIRSWDKSDWGDSVPVDKPLMQAIVGEYDALVLPGGQINPDLLRVDKGAVDFVRDFVASGKPVAAICHGPWLLVEADAVEGRAVTSYPSIRADMVNAGGKWRDDAVVTDEGIITSRHPGDLPAFIAKIVEEVEEGLHPREVSAA
jgi:protease I